MTMMPLMFPNDILLPCFSFYFQALTLKYRESLSCWLKLKTRSRSRWHAIPNPRTFTSTQRVVKIILLLRTPTTRGHHVASMDKFHLYANWIFFLCISVLRVASEPRVKLASCKSASTPTPQPVVYSTDRSKAAVPVLVLLFVALWFILRGDLFYVLPCVILFSRFTVPLALRLPGLGKGELILVLFVRLFDLRLFGFVCFRFLLMSGKGCGFWLWHSLDFSLTLFFNHYYYYNKTIKKNKIK